MRRDSFGTTLGEVVRRAEFFKKTEKAVFGIGDIQPLRRIVPNSAELAYVIRFIPMSSRKEISAFAY